MKLALRWLVTVLVLVSVLLHANRANAQSGIEMDLSASYKFGEQITFTAQIKSPVQIQKASILIQDTTEVITHVEPVSFNEQGFSEYRFDAHQNLMRPFTTVLWRYELVLLDGSTIQSGTGSLRYDDDRFVWQSLDADPVHIHWYDGGEQFGITALNAAQTGLQNIRSSFSLDLSRPVDVFIYASGSDLRGTLYGADAWVAGHADSAVGVITVTIEPGVNQNILMEQRIPHELMHVIMYRQVGAGYRNVPAWLREGIAMLAETYPNPDYDTVLKDAAAREVLIPIKDLCASFSPKADSAFLAYAESRSFTNYLRRQYGANSLLTLATTYANGVDCERGTESAFGVPLVKLERDWQATILGKSNILSTLGAFVPYLVLLCLVILFPLIGVIGFSKKKG